MTKLNYAFSVDIVIPVFNCERYLSQAIDSVLEQRYANCSVIVVDDGSTDESAALACEYANRYPERVTVVSQKNAGLSAARNSGLKKSQSDYICFLDSDDTYHVDFVGDCLGAAVEAEADIVFTDLEKIGESGDHLSYVRGYSVATRKRIYSGADRYELLLECVQGEKFRSIIQAKLFRLDFLTGCNFEFQPGRYFEDWLAMPTLISASNTIAYVDKPLLQYRVVQGSMARTFNERKLADRIYAWESGVKSLSEKNKKQHIERRAADKARDVAWMINVVGPSLMQTLWHKDSLLVLGEIRRRYSIPSMMRLALKYPKLKVFHAVVCLLLATTLPLLARGSSSEAHR